MTETKPSSKEILYYGEAKPLPEPVLLKAGPLSMLYENGAIRYIRYGDTEVLRRVYAALRDHNWDTVEPVIRQEKIETEDNRFRIELEVEYRQGDVHFVAHYLYTGTETGMVRFEMKGTCISSFKKNRIGFCVLHPIRECAGNECLITEPGGETTSQRFPSAISPHQPFMSIETMQWELPDAVTATLKFGGEVFETEDQRNWTDASFKTYSTPLALPFPVQMQAGEEIYQVVELSVRGNREATPNVSPDHKPLYFEISDRSADLPVIGLGRSTEVLRLTSEAIALLRMIGFHHYRVDVEFRKNWQDSLQLACEEAEALDMPLELALHFTGESYEREVEELSSLLSGTGATVYAFILLKENKKTTPPELIEVLVPVLRRYFPAAKIGGGTNAYFAELNRQTPPAEKLDFLSYSINPQVHAFDTLSLVETLETQGGTIVSAQKLAAGKDIHISPVTLKPRFNPNATTAKDGEQNPNDTVDVRQMSLIGAGWTLGSVKYL
ncbi:MAG: hypothetical protein KKG00_10165, partial [Bacteroidetes bacterium]|nr:hypothetical protein [Bacteroidota bacterium]